MAVAYFKVLSQNFSGGTEENHKFAARIADLQVRIKTT
jgi:hypothetical protein